MLNTVKNNLQHLWTFCRIRLMVNDRREYIGVSWNFIIPLISATVLYFLFKSRMMASFTQHYFLYIFLGIIVWNHFANTTRAGFNLLFWNPTLFKNVSFRKDIYLMGEMGVYLYQLIIELLIFILLNAIFGNHSPLVIIYLPILLVSLYLFSVGISFLLICIWIGIHDISRLWYFLMSIGIFLSPIFYEINEISSEFQWVIIINPITQFIRIAREMLLYQNLGSIYDIFGMLLLSILVFILGILIFNRRRYYIAENL